MAEAEDDRWKAIGEAKAETLDRMRPEAVAKQHARGALTARERIDGLFDTGSFLEYGQLAGPMDPANVAPADSVVMGTALLHGRAVAVVSCDYTAMGGSLGVRAHAKLTRFFALVEKLGSPLFFLAEGGGTRIQEMQHIWTAIDVHYFARLSGKVPLIGVVLGRAFAFQANIIGLCDFVVMTKAATLGISGPPLVAAALGKTMTCEEIGAAPMHAEAGTVDLVVETDQEALAAAAAYLSYIMDKRVPNEDTRDLVPSLRAVIPDNPRRAYDVRALVRDLCDTGSVLELRGGYARNGVTLLARLGGMAVGVVANQSLHLGGALDAKVCDKFARFITLCGRFGIPLVFLVDTPGFMVGPEAEQEGLVRKASRPVLALLEFDLPFATILLRRVYGTGSWAMGGDTFQPIVYMAWPTVEFGGMGLKGASDILEARNDAEAPGFLDRQKQIGTAISIARRFQVDDVVDPAETRRILVRAFERALQSWSPPADALRALPVPAW